MTDTIAVPSLKNFPRIPNAGKITVAEAHSELHASPSVPESPTTGRAFWPDVGRYTAVDGHQLTSRLPFKIPSIRVATTKSSSLILSKHQSIPKALWDSWWEEGLQGVHGCFLSAQKSATLGGTAKSMFKVFATVTSMCVKITNAPSKVLAYLFPHLEWKIEEVNEEFSRVRRWQESWIRAIAWNPTYSYLALGMNDDSVRCCVIDNDVVPMLRHQQQRNICCLAWRPFAQSELAVGCEDCIVIWYLTAGAMKPGKDRTAILKNDGHSPINSVEYSSDGVYLISSSAKDSSVYIWEACEMQCAPLRRLGGGGIPLALWSPTRERILTASPNKTFWIWENKIYWDFKRWETAKYLIEAACWHPTGSTLFFATGGYLYGLFFQLSPVDRFVSQTDAIVKPIYGIEETHMLDEDGNLSYKVGGKVRQILCDPSGHRVAIMFDDSEMIALFRVLNKSRTDLLAPLGFLRGHIDESPMAIAFQQDFTDGALLTIAWNSGRIQYFPMIFALPSEKKNILHEDHYRAQQALNGHPSLFAAAGLVSPKLSVSGIESASPRVSEIFGPGEEEPTSPSRLFSIPRN